MSSSSAAEARRYPPISDHGMIGDLQTLALVSNQGVLNWYCAPRFDSPSIFASLLDADRGGEFAITAQGRQVTTTQIYLSDSAVLVTRFFTPNGVGEVIDFMRIEDPTTASTRHRIVRGIRVVRGSVTFTVRCAPRFDYGRASHKLTLEGGSTAHFESADAVLHLQALDDIALTPDGDDAVASVTLTEGQVTGLMLTSDVPGTPPPERLGTPHELRGLLDEARHYWARWLSRCNYRGRWQQMVKRSAITLKLLIYAPTGAPIAAGTMGLPEQIGGERNWDYRFTWIRDGSLTVRALADIGFTEEPQAFQEWLLARLREGHTANGEPLQIMYRLDGAHELEETVLDHFAGWRGSAPVRAGNGAADQLQLDIYGEAAYALVASFGVSDTAGYEGWAAFARVLDWLSDSWNRKDEGIWETRGGRQNFTYSRVMCWAALNEGVQLALKFSRPGNILRWIQTRDQILGQVMDQGWNEDRQAFVQHYGSDVLDASLLLMPIVRFISPRDPQWLSTLDAIDKELVSDSLVYRYNPSASPDGLRGSEGTFSLCSFLYVAALATSERLDEARYAFEKMLTYANHVGLFAEEIGPVGDQLGNFPQAFTHLSLIMAAQALDTELDRMEREHRF